MESYIAAEFQSMGVFAGVPLHVLRDVVPLFELEEKPKQACPPSAHPQPQAGELTLTPTLSPSR